MKKKQFTESSHFKVLPAEKGRFLVYFPLKKTVMETDEDGIKELEKITSGKSPSLVSKELLKVIKENGLLDKSNIPMSSVRDDTRYMPTSVTLLPTMDCNLRCIYCYASAGERSSYMSMELGKAAVNFIIANAIVAGTKDVGITFHGGGEPTLNWELVTTVTQYAKILTESAGLGLSFSLGTNGCIPEKRLDWILENINNVCISLDGPPEVHDVQRPGVNKKGSFDFVWKTIQRFEKENYNYHIRTTVTKRLIPKLVSFYELLKEKAPGSKVLQLEPMFRIGRALNADEAPPSSTEFLNAYKSIRELSEKFNYPVTFAACDTDMVRDTYCGAYANNFVVTPSGHVTTCYEVSTPDDFRWTNFNVGHYDPETRKFNIYPRAIKGLRDMARKHLKKCKVCVARYHCAGDCPVKRISMELDGVANERCHVIQDLINEKIVKTAAQI